MLLIRIINTSLYLNLYSNVVNSNIMYRMYIKILTVKCDDRKKLFLEETDLTEKIFSVYETLVTFW